MLTVLVPVLILGVATFFGVLSNFDLMEKELIQARIQSAHAALILGYENLTETSRLIAIDNVVQEQLNATLKNDLEIVSGSRLVQVIADRIDDVSSLLDGVAIVGNNGILGYSKIVRENPSAFEEPITTTYPVSSNLQFFVRYQEDSNYIFVYRSIYGMTTGLPIGTMIFRLSSDGINQLLGVSDSIPVFLLDDNNNLLNSNPAFNDNLFETNHILIEILNPFNIFLLGTSSGIEATNVATDLWVAVLLVGISALILVLIIGEILLRKALTPISSLVHAMKTVGEGDLSTRAEVRGVDEFGYLSQNFNSMTEKMGNLIQEVYEEQTKRRNFEIHSITDQIKPHFLYNTLDSAAALAQLGKQAECFLLIRSISSFYRLVLSGGKEIITLGEEVAICKWYVEIQKIRYPNLFSYHITCPQELTKWAIPKLTLQPLIENAIYHGLKPKGSSGHIGIDVKEKDERIQICVIDDGVGFDSTNRPIDQAPDAHNSFGISAVSKRLSLLFQNYSMLKVTPHEEIGTKVLLEFPKILPGEKI